ncbi:unnamed protein product [Lepeophtheirus salmonis]|uniref:(salmon louse) hypothetical protein n=1 Tax=Lepeophtheirus salmonis TaxID=72036 RepID=A0A7R8D2D7_LEPSM|nr:unnamed protein product [Lepeophtheirus salmonis]CAF2956113.1 unnamed protein product [Lepeophtheirus salmonis]
MVGKKEFHDSHELRLFRRTFFQSSSCDRRGLKCCCDMAQVPSNGTLCQDFLDNGYDDMETVKQIGNEDLDAIGVSTSSHRAFLLDAVRVVKEQGAVWVYLLQQDRVSGSAHHPYHMSSSGDYDFGDRVSAGSSGIALLILPLVLLGLITSMTLSAPERNSSSSSGSARQNILNFNRTGRRSRSSPVSSSNRSSPAVNQRCLVELTPEHLQNRQELNVLRFKLRQQQSQSGSTNNSSSAQQPRSLNIKHLSSSQMKRMDYDARCDFNLLVILDSKSSLRNISPSRLSSLIKGKLNKEGLILSSSPFSSKISGDGYLLALASRYAFELNVEHRDVLRSLEDLRWEEENVHTYANTGLLIDRSTSSMQLKVPLKPGRYASSSCLSDKDDDIYDYTPEDETPPPSTTISSARSVHPTLSAGWILNLAHSMIRSPLPLLFSLEHAYALEALLNPPHFEIFSKPLSDEEISMRTLGLRQPRLKSREPLFPVSSAFYGTLSNSSSKPATPLVKQRTAGSASPRVQMYRTRVVYSDSVEAPPNGRITVTTARTNSHEAAV